MGKGVIFDMDGVLVASGSAHAASWRVVARRHEIEVSDERFQETFGRPSRDIIRLIWGEGLDDAKVRAIDDEKEAMYRELITGMVPLTIGTKEMLARLKAAGYLLSLATSGPRENVELVLSEKQLADSFVATVTGFDVKRGKPAPDCFELAAKRCELPVEACVVVEDAPVGIEAAIAAGMHAIGFVGTHPAQTLSEAGASVVVREMSEITAELIDELLATPLAAK